MMGSQGTDSAVEKEVTARVVQAGTGGLRWRWRRGRETSPAVLAAETDAMDGDGAATTRGSLQRRDARQAWCRRARVAAGVE